MIIEPDIRQRVRVGRRAGKLVQESWRFIILGGLIGLACMRILDGHADTARGGVTAFEYQNTWSIQ